MSSKLDVLRRHLVLKSLRTMEGHTKIELVYICLRYDLTKVITKHCTTGWETELWSEGVPTFWFAWGNATCCIIKLFLQNRANEAPQVISTMKSVQPILVINWYSVTCTSLFKTHMIHGTCNLQLGPLLAAGETTLLQVCSFTSMSSLCGP